MNLMGYDAMALGEADLHLGGDILRQHIADAHFPVLSANVVLPPEHDDITDPLFLDPYVLLEVGGRKLGIIGLTGGGMGPVVGWLRVADPAEALATYVKELHVQTNIIIVLSNLGWESNVELAETVPGIDVIISASGSEVLTERWQSPQTGTLVCQLGAYAREHPGWTVTIMQMTIDSDGLVTGYTGSFVELGPEAADDHEIRQLLDGYQTQR
jgi:2',3'-cyclic-nucleotide 2'-phosphodiesterase (5'-nucleotidase family)